MAKAIKWLTQWFRIQKKPRRIYLKHQGHYFDLLQLYQKINVTYFEGKLDLHITWFNRKKSKYTRRVVLGSFHKTHRLIKINRILDESDIPEYFIAFVIYHEILHHVFPPVIKKNKRQIHHSAFKEMEKKFHEYSFVKEFQAKNKMRWFLD